MARVSTTPARSNELVLGLAGARLAARWRQPGPSAVAVGIVLDGAVQAVLLAGPGGFEWPVPPLCFGRLLDVVAVESGRSLLEGPLDFEAARRVQLVHWAFEDGAVLGRFMVVGEAAVTGSPVPVALVADGARYGQGFALWVEGGYAFQMGVDRLPPGLAGVALQLAVGGLVLPPALHVPAAAFAFAGFLDPAEPWRVRGWAAERARPGRTVKLELRVDGRFVAALETDRARDDLAEAGFGGGRAGFDVALPGRLDRAALVDVRVAGGPSLGGSPVLRPAAPRFLGCLDGVDGHFAAGWAVDLLHPDRPVAVEALCDGAVIGAGQADFQRGDVAAAGLPTGRCGFHLVLQRPAGALAGREVSVRVAETGEALRGSPRRVVPNPNAVAFLARSAPSPAVRARLALREGGLRCSIVMPVYETPRDWLAAAIDSVRAQWSQAWELVCVDDGSKAAHVAAVLDAAAADPRIRVVRLAQNGGIAAAVNAGLRAATGDYVAFLDHDDALEPDAVHQVLAAARRTGAGLIYSDEVLTGPCLDQVVALRARPAWSHDYYMSHPYFVHLVAVQRTLALAVGGYDAAMPISADVDFVLRIAERAERVAHVPLVLYRWRTHGGSAGHARQADVMAATAGALTRHLRRLGLGAVVRPGSGFNQFRIDWPDDGGEILIVVPTRDRADLLRQCVDSVAATAAGARYRLVVIDHESTDPAAIRDAARGHAVMPYRGPFDFADMNNAAVRQFGAGARYVLFLNNDVEAIEAGWLGRLRSLVGRPDVGAVGPLLLYGNGRVQHAGVLIGFGAAADHAARFADPVAADGSRDPGYNSMLTSVRDYSAVTAACMMVRRELFERLGGFDTAFPVGFNDVDFCLRLRAAGLKVLYDGQTVLLHHESATRALDGALANPDGDEARLRARWPGYFSATDPFYHPLLSVAGNDHVLRADRGWRGRLGPRVQPA